MASDIPPGPMPEDHDGFVDEELEEALEEFCESQDNAEHVRALTSLPVKMFDGACVTGEAEDGEILTYQWDKGHWVRLRAC